MKRSYLLLIPLLLLAVGAISSCNRVENSPAPAATSGNSNSGSFTSSSNERDRRRQIETSNTESRELVLVKQMSAALGALKVHELNLGDASLTTLARGLRRALGNSKIKTDP